MATPILAQPSATSDAPTEASCTEHFDEFTALAQEIQEAEGVAYIEALAIALSLADEIAIFATIWDGWAFWQGNDRTMPF